jgi:hypothetical protein
MLSTLMIGSQAVDVWLSMDESLGIIISHDTSFLISVTQYNFKGEVTTVDAEADYYNFVQGVPANIFEVPQACQQATTSTHKVAEQHNINRFGVRKSFANLAKLAHSA